MAPDSCYCASDNTLTNAMALPKLARQVNSHKTICINRVGVWLSQLRLPGPEPRGHMPPPPGQIQPFLNGRPAKSVSRHKGSARHLDIFLLFGSAEWEWWAMCDLNARPSRCKRDALTSELTAHIMLSEARASVNGAQAQLCAAKIMLDPHGSSLNFLDYDTRIRNSNFHRPCLTFRCAASKLKCETRQLECFSLAITWDTCRKRSSNASSSAR